MTDVLSDPWFIAGFYAVLILLIYLFRSKFEFQGKIIALLRTNWGVSFMQKYGEKHGKSVRFLGYVGIVVAFLGMLVITGFILFGIYQLFANPSAPPVLSPVLPGVKIPGSPISLPLFEGLIALFIVIVIHESAHGLVGAAHGLKIKSSGLVLFGPIPGAFVEPDEESLKSKEHKVQHSVFAAGPWSNILTAFLFLLLLVGVGLFAAQVSSPQGVIFEQVSSGSPAEMSGLPPGELITSIDGVSIQSAIDLVSRLENKSSGDSVVFGVGEEEYVVTLGEYTNNDKACLGITGIQTKFDLEDSKPFLWGIISFINATIYWTFVLSLGLGLANLLPLGPVDGGRMIQLVLRKKFGEIKGDLYWGKWSWSLLIVIVMLVLVPILRAVFTPEEIISCLPI